MNHLVHRAMTLDEFEPLVGQTFEVDAVPAKILAQLVEASPAPPTGYPDRPPFILVFRTEPTTMLLTGTYKMQAKGFGPDMIHISDMVPPPGSEAGYYYQAVFN